jgi:hypothetical protein
MSSRPLPAAQALGGVNRPEGSGRSGRSRRSSPRSKQSFRIIPAQYTLVVMPSCSASRRQWGSLAVATRWAARMLDQTEKTAGNRTSSSQARSAAVALTWPPPAGP